LACPKTRAAILIDPVKELVDRDLALIKELDLNVCESVFMKLLRFSLFFLAAAICG